MVPATSSTLTPVAVSGPMLRSRKPVLVFRSIRHSTVGRMSRSVSISVSCSAASAERSAAAADLADSSADRSEASADRSASSADFFADLAESRWYLRLRQDIPSAIAEKTAEIPSVTHAGASPQSILTTRTVAADDADSHP